MIELGKKHELVAELRIVELELFDALKVADYHSGVFGENALFVG